MIYDDPHGGYIDNVPSTSPAIRRSITALLAYFVRGLPTNTSTDTTTITMVAQCTLTRPTYQGPAPVSRCIKFNDELESAGRSRPTSRWTQKACLYQNPIGLRRFPARSRPLASDGLFSPAYNQRQLLNHCRGRSMASCADLKFLYTGAYLVRAAAKYSRTTRTTPAVANGSVLPAVRATRTT